MKIAFGIIVLNGNNTLEESLKTIYPYASQILIAEGPVKYWQEHGYTTSTDGTNEMIDNFPDPENKIKIVHSQYEEKLQQTNAYIEYMNDDIDYLWNLDSDQVFKSEDIETVIRLLEESDKTYTLVTFKSMSFFGGFDHYLTGFEEKAKFPGLFKVYPGSKWLTHRYPKMIHKQASLPDKVLDSEFLASKYGIRIYHYSYVFADHLYQKSKYYREYLGALGANTPKNKGRNTIMEDYFYKIWMPWVNGNEIERQNIENKYKGVHEFIPEKRGDCYTTKFTGTHPKIIQDNMNKLIDKFNKQREKYNGNK